MIPTSRREQHEHLFNLFVKELFCDPVKTHKSNFTLHKKPSTRLKFLQKMKEQAKRDPGKI